MRKMRLPAAALALQLGVACGTSPGGQGAVVRDSAGIRIVENAGAASSDHSTSQIDARPTLTIGAGPTEEDQLFRVVGATRLSDGRIAVANGGSLEVRMFGADGRFLRALGGPGDGPGEFRSVYGMYRLPADSLAVYDTRLQRMSVFTGDGAFARSFGVTPPEGSTRAVPVGPLGGGQWLMVFSQRIGRDLEPGPVRLTAYFARYDETGNLIDTVAAVPGFEIFVYQTSHGRAVPAVPFGRGVGAATRADGFLVAVNDSYQIREYDRSGGLRGIVRRAVAPRSITADDRAAALAAQLESVSDPVQRQLLTQAYQAMSVPAVMPAIGASAFQPMPWIVTSPSGGFWVVDYLAPGDTAARWSIFDADGRLLRVVDLPARFRLYEVGGDYLLGVQRDSLDVEHVVTYGLVAR